MKHYLSTLAVDDHDSTREYYSHTLIVAQNEQHARLLQQSQALRFGGHEGREVGRAYRFGEADGAGYTVYAHALKEISPASFAELSSSFQVVGGVDAGSLAEQEPAEQAKTLARRLGDQLAKRGVKVSHSHLLHAVAASLGKTDWQVLAHQSKPAASEDQWYPAGNWPTTPLRNAESLSYAARVNAIWLTHGDVKLAARLLHVEPESLMGSFKTAMEADTAFCGRMTRWLPEHSLDQTLTAAEEGHSFHVKATALPDGLCRVDGYVGDSRAVSLNNFQDPYQWELDQLNWRPMAGYSVNLLLACFNASLREANELRNRQLDGLEAPSADSLA
jgi:hypothetical protein